MGVPAQLQVHTVLLGLFQLIGLMVEQDNVMFPVYALQELFHALAVTVNAVIAPDNGDAIDGDGVIPQNMDVRHVQQVKSLV